MNIVGVGASLAAMTGAILAGVFKDGALIPIVTAIPTLLAGMLWVRLLRWDKTVAGTSMRIGWILSLPIAVLNAAFACGLMLAAGDRSPFIVGDTFKTFVTGMLAGATFGAIIWIPALVATLVTFGLPLARAQQLAKKGLAGAERGEAVVGASSTVIGALALILSMVGTFGQSAANLWFPRLLAVLGVALGMGALVSAREREAQRKKFVEAVERGEVEKFRVDTTDEGKVLVRVVSQGQGYRVADFEEEIAAIDHQGDVTRGVRVATEG
ncbi:MAG: hypothetical protein JNK05_07165 [Myxococcales bacterium]|nr:hypothetical protein [Myxococcales bacterium]